MAVQLTTEEKKIVVNTMQQYLPNIEFKIFGSRAKGHAKEFSDLDIVILSQEKIPLQDLFLVTDAFAESDLPFIVDLVDWQRITEEFREIVKQQMVAL